MRTHPLPLFALWRIPHGKEITRIMRIDKFLKVSRIIKRRTVANDACDAAHVSVNGRQVKASYDVKEGDIIEITFGERTLRVRVKDVREFVAKADASSLYEVID